MPRCHVTMCRPAAFLRTTLSTLAILLAAPSLPALAGPIDPPPGPVASTGKTLQEIFDKTATSGEKRIPINAATCPGDAAAQFRITQPGSYYLEANLLGETGPRHVLQIAAAASTDGVTVDLNGFVIGPEVGATITADVINCSGSANRILIRNGTVRASGATGDGIDTGGSVAARLENLRISNAGSFGVRGSGAQCENVHVISSIGTGFSMANAALLRSCTATACGGHGFSASSSRLIDCTATSNALSGFNSGLASSNFFSGCFALSNTQHGFNIGGSARIESCTAAANGLTGFSIAAAAAGSAVVLCSANTNGNEGFSTSATCVIERCTADANGTAGAGFAGFRINAGTGTRLEGNTASRNDFGILIATTATLVVRNTCTANSTNWSISAGNHLGPILIPGTNASAFNGNAAAGTLGSTDPNANFTY